jgi:hypothetical protein
MHWFPFSKKRIFGKFTSRCRRIFPASHFEKKKKQEKTARKLSGEERALGILSRLPPHYVYSDGGH